MPARTGHDASARALSERQARIVDVAMRIIATRGARRFTAQLLATEVGVTGGAIYRHFESMEAVVDAVVDRMGSILFEGFPPDAVDPIERLGLFFRNRTLAIRDNPLVSRLLHSDNLAQASGSVHAERLQELKRRSRRFIVDCLQEAAAAGALADDLTPEVGAIIVQGAIHALSHHSPRIVTERQIEPLAEKAWSAIERLLRNPVASGRRDLRRRRLGKLVPDGRAGKP